MTEPCVAGLILAGGLARRMGGIDKALISIAGRPVIEHVLDRFAPQAAKVVINANGSPERFAAYGLDVVADRVSGFAGPLAGVHAGMVHVRDTMPGIKWLVTAAVDTPFLPSDLVARLFAALNGAGAQMACAASGGRHHPVFGLWPVALAGDLHRAMVDEDMRKVDRWTARYQLAVAEFSTTGGDPFFNTNRPEDIVKAEQRLAGPQADKDAAGSARQEGPV